MTTSTRAWPAYGSDLVVDFLRERGVPYAVFNPGASFRGLHDSLVNDPSGAVEPLEVLHEKIAVGIAHGYAKVTGRPLAVILHDLVGLLHGTLGVYYAATDRIPILVLGGAGPMDQARRRPWIDWIHTANVQSEALRAFTKWDDQPFSVEAVLPTLDRAMRVAEAEPQGPTYVALDALIQEEELGARVLTAPVPAPGTRIGPDPAAIDRIARALVAAERPLTVVGFAGRDPAAWELLQRLAEMLPLAVVDTNLRLNFPNRHPLNVTGAGLTGRADVVLLLDIRDIGQHTELYTKHMVAEPPRLAPGAQLIDLGLGELGMRAWSADQGQSFSPDLRVTADSAVALPLLVARVAELMAQDRGPDRAPWRAECEAAHRRTWAGWQAEVTRTATEVPISYPWLAAEVGHALEGHDWVLTAGSATGWALRTWDFDRPHRHAGRTLGTATQVGISLGVALAHRGTGRLVVDLQPDGDLLFDASALWAAIRHRIPMLMVMVNNRAYHNDVVHQEEMAVVRGRPMERSGIGVVLGEPATDFAMLARSFGWWAEGPVTDPAAVRATVRRAAEVVATTGRPALVDVIVGRP